MTKRRGLLLDVTVDQSNFAIDRSDELTILEHSKLQRSDVQVGSLASHDFRNE
jgi:hypothetical protein